jgi:hypothetical protein
MDKVDELIMKLEDIKEVMFTADQVSVQEGLSDIDENLGLIKNGKLYFGTGDPGKGFTGLRVGYPAFTYGSTNYLMAGVDADTMRWGVRSSDGSFELADEERGVGNVTYLLGSDMVNSWVNYDTEATPEIALYDQAHYWKEGNTVHLGGLVKGGTVGASTAGTIFQITDSSYWPDDARIGTGIIYAVISNAAVAQLRLIMDTDLSALNIVAYSGNNAWYSLSGASWRTST